MNNKGADQTARMRRLVCDCVVKKTRRQVFSRRGPYIKIDQNPLFHRSVQDQTARMRRLVCACVVKKTNRRQVFSRRGPYIKIDQNPLFHCSVQEITFGNHILVKSDISKCWCDLENKINPPNNVSMHLVKIHTL